MEKKEIKILYHGPGISGRNSNLEHIYSKVFDPKYKSFDYKPFTLSLSQIEEIVGLNVWNKEFTEQIFIFDTAPMSIFNDPCREKFVNEMDAFVFVVDSQIERIPADIEILLETESILSKYNRNLKTIPWVIQYNKRDLPNILSINDLQKELNGFNVPYFEAIANKGVGVIETFTAFINEIAKFYK